MTAPLIKIIIAIIIALIAVSAIIFVYKNWTPPQPTIQKETAQQNKIAGDNEGSYPQNIPKEKLKPPYGTLIPIFEPSTLKIYSNSNQAAPIAVFEANGTPNEIKKFYTDYFAANLAASGWEQRERSTKNNYEEKESVSWESKYGALNESVSITIRNKGENNSLTIAYVCMAGGGVGTSVKCPGLQDAEANQ